MSAVTMDVDPGYFLTSYISSGNFSALCDQTSVASVARDPGESRAEQPGADYQKIIPFLSHITDYFFNSVYLITEIQCLTFISTFRPKLRLRQLP